MKLIILSLAVFAAYAAALPHGNAYIDVVMNILEEPSRGRIAGGREANPNEFPHQVALLWGSGGTKSHLCGASIIGSYTLLTAAHCQVYNFGAYSAKLGLHKHDNNPVELDIRNENWKLHKGYPGGNVVSPYDIAVIVFDEPFQFNESVAPIALGDDHDSDHEEHDTAIVSGWGATGAWRGVEKLLRTVTAPRISNTQCGGDLTRILGGRPHPLDDSMICISNSQGSYKGTCGGDSGGPLYVVHQNVKKLIGVVSWGISPCAYQGAPSVFTRVATYLDWIAENSSG